MHLYNYKYNNLFLQSYLQPYLQLKVENQVFLNKMFSTFECRVTTSRLYIFLMCFIYLQLIFCMSNAKILFNKRKTKNKYRRSTYKDVTVYFIADKTSSYYSSLLILNNCIADNYIESSIMPHSFFNLSDFDRLNPNNFSFGFSISSFFRIASPYISFPIEIKTILKSYFQKLYFQVHFSSSFYGLDFYYFFIHNLSFRYIYPFLNYNE